MVREINKLSARRVVSEKRVGRHPDGAGLYLSISANGGRRWVFIFKRGGRSREMGLGSATTVSLGLARDLAEAARGLLAKGSDPIAEREAREREAATSLTFRQCAERYIEANKSGWKNAKHADQWRSTLEQHVYAVAGEAKVPIGDMPVPSVGVADVIKVLAPIWSTKTETASRVRGRIETVLDWAKANEYRTGENPARWRGHLDKLLPARSKVRRVRHHPALPYAEIPAFIADLRKRNALAAVALEFTILTAARTGAVIGATIGEFDIAEKVWSVPPERAGTKIDGEDPKPRRVPLSPRALEIVENVLLMRGPSPKKTALLFPGESKSGGLSNNAMLSLLERMGRGDITVHGFRSTFKDWCSEATNYAGEVSEAALWHVVADKVEAAYRRGDLFVKRTALMSAWAGYCSSSRGGKVVPMSRAGAK
jgi:integrase